MGFAMKLVFFGVFGPRCNAGATGSFGNTQDKGKGSRRTLICSDVNCTFDLGTTKERTNEGRTRRKNATSERSFGHAQLVCDFYKFAPEKVERNKITVAKKKRNRKRAHQICDAEHLQHPS